MIHSLIKRVRIAHLIMLLLTFSLGVALAVLFTPGLSLRSALPSLRPRNHWNFTREERRWLRFGEIRSSETVESILDSELAASVSVIASLGEVKSLIQLQEKIAKAEAEGRPYIGVYLDKTRRPGLLVTKVEPGSPADQAGLAEGDAIIEFNKMPINFPSDLYRAVFLSGTGSWASCKVIRRGYVQELMVRPVAKPMEMLRFPRTRRSLNLALARIQESDAVEFQLHKDVEPDSDGSLLKRFHR